MRSRRDARKSGQAQSEAHWWNDARVPTRICVVLAVVFYVVIVSINAWLGDDAYITFRTVDNFIHGHGLTWNVSERVQTYTNPLWMFVMSLAYWMTHEMYFTAIAVSIALSATAACLLAFRLSKSAWGALISIAILTFSKAFVDYSTSGLENPLTHLILAVFFIVYLKEGVNHSRRLYALALLAALGTVNRLDTLLLFAPVIVVEFIKGRRLRDVVPVLLGFSPLVLWEAFSLFYYGFPFPNTAYAKLNTHISKMELVTQGVMYFRNSLETDPLTLTIVALALVLVLIGQRDWRLPVAAGMTLYMGYIVWIGGDFMSGRFFTALLFSAAAILSCTRWNSVIVASVVIGSIAVMSLLSPRCPLFGGGDEDLYRVRLIDRAGISDERIYYFPTSALTRVGKPETYGPHWSRLVVRREGSKEILSVGSIGQAGHVGGPNTHVLDPLALGDPLLARLPALWNPSWRIGHFGRVIPEGYMETLETGVNTIADPGLAAYYDKLCVITKSKLLDTNRLREIVNMNMSKYDDLIDVDRYQRSPYAHARSIDIQRLSEPKKEGTRWLEAGNTAMDQQGVEVWIGDTPRSDCLEVSLDSSDRYEIAFMSAGKMINRTTLGPTNGRGLVTYYVRVLADLASVGFDTIRVRPLEGDDRYSIGHLRFLMPDASDFTGVRLQVPVDSTTGPNGCDILDSVLSISREGLQLEYNDEVSLGLVSLDTVGVREVTLVYFRDGYELGRQTTSSSASAAPGVRLHVIRVPQGVSDSGFDMMRIVPVYEAPEPSVRQITLFYSDSLKLLRERRDLPEVEIQYSTISSPRKQGTDWADRTRILEERGIGIRLDGTSHASQLEISVDHNDEYEIVFFNGDKSVGRQLITARLLATAGLRVDLVEVPEDAAEAGYDGMNVYPVSGDGLYSIGHIRLGERDQ